MKAFAECAAEMRGVVEAPTEGDGRHRQIGLAQIDQLAAAGVKALAPEVLRWRHRLVLEHAMQVPAGHAQMRGNHLDGE